MLPPNPVCRHGVFGNFGLFTLALCQRIEDIVRIGGFGQIVQRSEFYGGNGGCNIAIAGQNDDLRIVPVLPDRLDDFQTIAIRKPQIDHRILRRRSPGTGYTVTHRLGRIDGKAACFHCPGKPAQKRAVIIDDQQRSVGPDRIAVVRWRAGGVVLVFCLHVCGLPATSSALFSSSYRRFNVDGKVNGFFYRP